MNEITMALDGQNPIIGYILIDMAVAIILLAGVRFTRGFMGKISTRDELAKKDNFAFGISLAGGVFAMGIALSGAITGESAGSYLVELIGMCVYGLCGMLLIIAGRFIHDKFALPSFKKHDLIIAENISVGIVDAASVIATAIIVRAALIWVEGIDIYTFVALISAWIVSQIMLVVITKLFDWKYSKNNTICFQTALESGEKMALAIRYSGYLISTAMSVTAASYFIEFEHGNLVFDIGMWIVMSVILMFSLTFLTTIAKKLVLFGIDCKEEVEDQDNIGIATIEFATSFSIALLLMALMA